MMGDCLIFTSPDVPSVPGIGWHRDIQHGAAGYNYTLQLQLSIKFPKIALHITPKSIFILNVVFVKLAVHI